VPQETVLFCGTIFDNLQMANPAAGFADIVRACRLAEIHDTIEALPQGYQSEIGERGAGLSGGQKQRIAIARAFLKNPPIMVLDEATSALDPVVEKKIDDNLRRRGCSCIVSAHRLSTVRDCDEIVVLERGQIVQRGQHEDLLRQGGTYGRLIRAQ